MLGALVVAGVLALTGRNANDEPELQSSAVPASERWEAFDGGPDGSVNALAVFAEPGDPAGHPVLYAGGRFATAGGKGAKCIAKWHKSHWSPVGGGLDGESVEALIVFDEDGDGPDKPALYAGGDFNGAGGVQARSIARWNGTEWSAVGGGVDGLVIDLAVFDEDQEGPRLPALFAAGIFGRAGNIEANNIAKWDGHEWSAVGERMIQPVYSLMVGDPDGDGPKRPALVVGGMTSVDLWSGTTWYSFGGPGFRTFALATFDHDGDGRPTLYAAGQIISSNAAASNTVAWWGGKEWIHLAGALNERVYAMTVFDPDGDGPVLPALYVAGSFNKVGDRPAHGLARWDGTSWSILENGPRSDPLTPRMNSLVAYDPDASGPMPAKLCVGGLFTLDDHKNSANIAAWSGGPSTPDVPETGPR